MLLKPDIDSFPLIAITVGLITAVPALFALIAPARAEKLYKAFPRSIWPGRIIIAISFIWSTIWLVVMPFGFLTVLHPYLWFLTPALILSAWFFIPDLLSCRALGCLFALVPTPMLSSAQWLDSPLRYVVIVYAYVLAVFGMFYIALPYLVRDHITWTFVKPTRVRAIAATLAVIGIAHIIIGIAA